MSARKYSELGKIISEKLKLLGMSQHELGRSVGRHAQWINGLMKPTAKVHGGRKEDFDALFRILSAKEPGGLKRKSVANPNGRPKRISIFDPKHLPSLEDTDEMTYLRLLLSLLDRTKEVDRYMPSYSFEYLLKLQESLNGSDIWVFTPTLGESQNEKYAVRTIDGILSKGNTYRFFLPFDSEQMWRLGLERLQASYERMKTRNSPKLEDRLEIFGVNMLMVHSVTLINPMTEGPTAHISIGAWDASTTNFVPLHADRVKENIQRYRNMHTMGQRAKAMPAPDDAVEDTSSGIKVKCFFPH